MNVIAEPWSDAAGAGVGPGAPAAARRRRGGAAVVWRLELAKLAGQVRVWAVLGVCAVVPFLVAGAVEVQSAVPQDTLFGQWLHTSGFALPLVILGFAGQWVLPLLTAVVAGDIFSSEDHYGTWKTVLTRSRSRGELFAGKLAAALTYAVVMLALLTAASLAAGAVVGTGPLVGLSGQLVPGGHAFTLVLASWATQLPPVLGFAALAVLASVVARHSVVGIGVPLLAGLVMQLTILVNLPGAARDLLLATPFASWHGLWVQAPFYGPLRHGLVTSAGWFVVCTGAAWMVFRRRSVRGGMTGPSRGSAHGIRRHGRSRRIFLAAAGVAPCLLVAACGSTGISPTPLQASLSRTFANLYALQQTDQGNPRPSPASLQASAACQKGSQATVQGGAGNDWLCQVTFLVAGPSTPVTARYNVDVQTDGCYSADGDGPASVNGSRTVTGPGYRQVVNPLWLIDGCFDVT